MFYFDHDTDHDTRSDGDLLAEVGLDPRAISEILSGGDGD